MTRKEAYVLGTSLLIVLVAATFLAPTILRARQRQQVQWWLDHSYPIFTNLLPEKNRYFASYEEFRQAGRDIPGAGPILIDMYNRAESESDKANLLYAMGAVGTPETNAFVCNIVLLSARSSSAVSDEFCPDAIS